MDSRLEELIDRRKLIQVSMFQMRDGANRRWYEGKLAENSRELTGLGANVFVIDDHNRPEVESRGGAVAAMPLSRKAAAALRGPAGIMLLALAAVVVGWMLFGH